VAILRATLAGVWAFPEDRRCGLRRAWKRCRGGYQLWATRRGRPRVVKSGLITY